MSQSIFFPTIFEAAANGDIDIVKDWIDPRRRELRRDKDGNTALHFASRHGHDDIVELLLQSGSSPHSKNSKGETALHEAAKSNSVSVAIMLVTAGVSPEVESNEKQTGLDVAVAFGSVMTAAYLVGASSSGTIWAGFRKALRYDDQAEIMDVFEDSIDFLLDDETRAGNFLLVSAYQGDEKAARYLLDHGVSPNDAIDHNGATPLHLAASFGHVHIAKDLLDAGAEVNVKDSMGGGTPLFAAIQGQKLEVVKVLLDAGATTDIVLRQRRLRRDLVHITAQDESPEILQLLFDLGMDPNTRDEAGATAAMHSAGNGHLETLKVLRAGGCDIFAASEDGTTPLIRAALGGHTDVISWLLDQGADIHASDVYEATSLKAAIQGRHVESVQLLCSRGAEVTTGRLREAISRGSAEIVSILVSHGAKLSGTQQDCEILEMVVGTNNAALTRELVKLGQSIDKLNPKDKLEFLLEVTRKEYVDCVEAFLEQCEDRSLANEVSRVTPIHLAAEVGNVTIFNMLAEGGFSLHKRTQYGQTPLHLAALQGRAEIIRELRGVISTENQDGNGNTPLHWASSKGHETAVKELLRQGASVRAKNDYGITPLHLACSEKHVTVAQALLDAGASPSTMSLSMTNALHVAVQTSEDIVRKLLETGRCDINTIQARGKTALLLASSKSIAAMLLYHGADVSASSSDGYNALCTAALAGKTELFEYLFPKFEEWLVHDANQITLWRLICRGGSTDILKFLETTQVGLRDLDSEDLLSLLAEASSNPEDCVLSNVIEALLDVEMLQDLNLASRILLLAVEAECVESTRILASLKGIHDVAFVGGRSPLDRAKKGDNSALVEALIETGAGGGVSKAKEP
ncbi:hypothetical protein D7B24_002884 [Verticillium nonalfalfae]|uniref:Uncharacterized protein n=1 Tax=Verticillium nonalfalfae TaxID=1051616 RepID=A0A3M9XXY1_9PEZI|nr:uncharacterized protein D7B24_002884 [Verticillium nonalfalfae]RNJ52775.1 hypothetical protein D7B24_002884 [Verticillium nonalfalfae]